jgi:hypothetical protein
LVAEHRPFDRPDAHMQSGGRSLNDAAADAAVSPSDRLADRLAAARRMQLQQLQAVAASAKPAAAAACEDAATVAVNVKVLTKPQPTVSRCCSPAVAPLCNGMHVRITRCSCRCLPV